MSQVQAAAVTLHKFPRKKSQWKRDKKEKFTLNRGQKEGKT